MNKPTLGTKKKNITLSLNLKKKLPAARTVVVLGVERGGTSMAAGVVRGLGVDMGERAGLNHEDPLFLTDETDRLQNRIKMRNKANPVWGFKVPKASLMLEFYEQHLRNPFYVIVYRNSVAVADSWVQRGAGNVIDVLERSHSYHEALLKHCKKTKNPVLFLNYERAVQDDDSKLQTVTDVSDFLGLEVDQEQIARAVGMMTGDGKGYVNLPEHYFLITPKNTPTVGAEIPLEYIGAKGTSAVDPVVQEKIAPQLIHRVAGEAETRLPKAFWLEVDLDIGKSVDLAGTPIRVYFNFIDKYFPGHCTRPELKRGKNWLYVETSGQAKDFAFGPIMVPMTFKIDVKMHAVAS